MRNIRLSFVALIAMGTLGHAGGDFYPITPYETQDSVLAEETYVEEAYIAPVEETYVEEAYIAPTTVTEVPLSIPVENKKDVSANGFYAGLGIAAARYAPNCKCTSKNGIDKSVGLTVRVGYDFNKYIGLEARGINSNLSGDGGTVKHAGVFIKPMIPVTDAVNIYGLVGLAKTTTQGRLQRTDAETLAMGAGVEVDLSEDSPKSGRYNREFDGAGDQEKGIGLFVDYEKMVVKSGAPDLDAVSAGVTYDF